MFESLKTTPAYKLYRQSLIYDTVRRHGKVLKRAIKLPRYLGTEYRVPGLRRRVARLQADVEVLLA